MLVISMTLIPVETSQAQVNESQPAEKQAQSSVDPEALTVLKEMSDALSSLKESLLKLRFPIIIPTLRTDHTDKRTTKSLCDQVG